MSRPTAHRKSPSVILERLKNATPLIEALMTIAGTPGISIGVMYQGEIILSTGYGYAQVERSVPATAKTVYPLASLSKAFASAACGLLVSDGKLSWGLSVSHQLWPILMLEQIPLFQTICHRSSPLEIRTLVILQVLLMLSVMLPD